MRKYQSRDVACVMQSDARNGASISAANPLRDADPLNRSAARRTVRYRRDIRQSGPVFFSFLWRNEPLGSEAREGKLINCFRCDSLTLSRDQHFSKMSIWRMTVLRSVWGKQGCDKGYAVRYSKAVLVDSSASSRS